MIIIMPSKMPPWDVRMVLLMRHCIDLQLCDSQKEFCESIGLVPTNLFEIKRGTRSFTIQQIVTACKKYKINISWIFGFSTEMKYTKSKTALHQLKDAVRSIESELTK